jgi:hypothetical protein
MQSINELKEKIKSKRENHYNFISKHIDNVIRDYYVTWIKDNLYIGEGKSKKTIEYYIIKNDIIKENDIQKYMTNDEYLITLSTETIYNLSVCRNVNTLRDIFSFVLDNGYCPNRNEFFYIIQSDDYLNIISKKNIFDELKIIYKHDVFEMMNNNFKKNIYELFFSDIIYDQKDLKNVFIKKPGFINYIFAKNKYDKNIKIDEKHFDILILYNMYEAIANLMINGNENITNYEKCFKLLFEKIENNHIVSFKRTEEFQITYIFKEDIPFILEIYKIFINKLNISNETFERHINIFFKKDFINFIDFLIKEKNVFPNIKNFESFVLCRDDNMSNLITENQINKYFPDINFTENELYLSCLHKKEFCVKTILEQKITPTKRCFLAILENFPDTTNINTNTNIQKLISKSKNIIENFILYSYKLSNQDIISITKKKITLNKSYFTQNIIFTEEEKEEFYECCDFNFMPDYSVNLYNDELWLRRMCKAAKKIDDYKAIKNYMKRTGYELDFLCYVYLVNNNGYNRMKDELLALYKNK